MRRGAWPVFFTAAVIAAPSPLAVPGAPGGGKARERRLAGNDLYGHIDGGAEIFREFGFRELTIRDVPAGEGEISVEVYRMATAEGALDIYLMQSGRESPDPGIDARCTRNRWQAMAVKGRLFVEVNNFRGEESLAGTMTREMRRALDGAGDESAAPLFDALPAEGRVPGSERLFAGPLALQSICTLGEGDILRLGGEIYGASCRYGGGEEGAHTRLRVAYRSAGEAEAVFAGLRARLDPLLRVITAGANRLVFRDYAGRFGVVSREGPVLDLCVGLSDPPSDRVE